MSFPSIHKENKKQYIYAILLIIKAEEKQEFNKSEAAISDFEYSVCMHPTFSGYGCIFDFKQILIYNRKIIIKQYCTVFIFVIQ
jgi:hypothetical protein